MRQFTETFYQNEHLIYGHLGHLLIIIAFVSSIFAFGLGLKAFLKKESSMAERNQIKLFFWIHTWSIFIILGLMIFLFKSQYLEYHYVWRHSSSTLPWYYIFSALWEGQEGSFLLWIFWHAILGIALLRNFSEMKLGALSILMLIQSFLFTMILGVDVFGKLIGTNPFILLRDEMSIPILSNPNYLELIKDGNGLNILLQNYWMVIHPPVLFLGFASASIPFAFATASLLKKDFVTWTKEVQTWSLFSMALLGTGILMGGRWAYEALSFGGFWAWDPVENASLVPWLFLVAGVHTLMIYRATQHSLRATYVLYILAFGFVLYSTFLTRSGILGDSSVHSFTDLGMTGQLLIFLVVLILPVFMLLAFYWSRIEQNNSEEKTWSREFWMFLGALFIVVSALQIAFTTSIPVWNKIYDLKLAPPINANSHYNSIQIWFAIVVCTLMGFSLWMFYKDTKDKKIIRGLLIEFLGCVVLAGLICYMRDISVTQQYTLAVGEANQYQFDFISSFWLLLTSVLFLISRSIAFIFFHLRNQKILVWGGSIAHIGFGVLILGALISQYEKKPISINKARIDFGKDLGMDEQSSNSLLMVGEKEEMGDYWVSYRGKEKITQGEKYRVFFVNKSNAVDTFSLYPEAKIIKEGAMGSRLNPEPSIKHLWSKDLFAHVSSVPEDNTEPKAETKSLKIHDTFFSKNSSIVFDSVMVSSDNAQGQIDLKAKLLRKKRNEPEEILYVAFKLNTHTGQISNPVTTSADSTIAINLVAISPEKQQFDFSMMDTSKTNDWIILKVLEFPHISLLWIGCLIMVVGTLMSMFYRRRTKTATAAE
jgi:cytochrome c-type biogenesis protein CcmF